MLASVCCRRSFDWMMTGLEILSEAGGGGFELASSFDRSSDCWASAGGGVLPGIASSNKARGAAQCFHACPVATGESSFAGFRHESAAAVRVSRFSA